MHTVRRALMLYGTACGAHDLARCYLYCIILRAALFLSIAVYLYCTAHAALQKAELEGGCISGVYRSCHMRDYYSTNIIQHLGAKRPKYDV